MNRQIRQYRIRGAEKKYKSTVYKRRISLHETEAMQWISGIQSCSNHTQISDEIDYFLNYYNPLHPTVFLSYKREAFMLKMVPTFE